MKKLLLVLFSWMIIMSYNVSATDETPQQVLKKFDFADKVKIFYDDSVFSTTQRGIVITYSDLTHKIYLRQEEYANYNKKAFLHELAHVIRYQRNIDLEDYMIFVHGRQYKKYSDENSWLRNSSECFAEDISTYLAKKIYGLELHNTTAYDYNMKVGWYLARNNIDLGGYRK